MAECWQESGTISLLGLIYDKVVPGLLGRLQMSSVISILWRRLRKLLEWRPATVSLPRRHCHYIVLDVLGVPTRMLPASIRLQLIQLTGLSKLGFVFQVCKEQACVWYWDESGGIEEVVFSQQSTKSDWEPWPETVLRPFLADGEHLLQLDEGYEALSVKYGQVHRTRWYLSMPAEPQWLAFMRDSGSVFDGSMPVPKLLPVLQVPPKNWRLHTTWQTPTSGVVWVGGLCGVMLLGLILAMGTYQVKLDLAIAREQALVEQISRENAKTIALQEEISAQVDYMSRLQEIRPQVLQLELMEALGRSGLLDIAQGNSLLEWEYRSNQLRLLFAAPAEDFVLSEFLSRLENLPIFQEIRLLPDTPPKTVGVQAVLAPRQEPVKTFPATDHLVEQQGEELSNRAYLTPEQKAD